MLAPLVRSINRAFLILAALNAAAVVTILAVDSIQIAWPILARTVAVVALRVPLLLAGAFLIVQAVPGGWLISPARPWTNDSWRLSFVLALVPVTAWMRLAEIAGAPPRVWAYDQPDAALICVAALLAREVQIHREQARQARQLAA